VVSALGHHAHDADQYYITISALLLVYGSESSGIPDICIPYAAGDEAKLFGRFFYLTEFSVT
jgi:hypothetical protein